MEANRSLAEQIFNAIHGPILEHGQRRQVFNRLMKEGILNEAEIRFLCDMTDKIKAEIKEIIFDHLQEADVINADYEVTDK